MFPSYAESLEGSHNPPRLSGFSDIDQGLDSWQLGRRSLDLPASPERTSHASVESGKTYTTQTMEEVEAEMRRLKQELKQTMDMYSLHARKLSPLKRRQRSSAVENGRTTKIRSCSIS